jgi:hypothetical protein
MNKEILRMQLLAGIITEYQFKYMLGESINEGKNVGELYHFTDVGNIENIINHGLKFHKDNSELEKYKNKFYISTTRSSNPEFIEYGNFDAKIILDGDKISNKYKIKPINVERVWGTYDDFDQNDIDSKIGQYFEERIYSNTNSNLSPQYIKKIEIYPSNQLSNKEEFDKYITKLKDNPIFDIEFIDK